MTSTEKKAKELLEKLEITSPPVSVAEIGRALGLEVEEANLGPDVSGVLVIRDGTGTIGFNKDQSKVRQRFSIAHEIGHFVLHHKTRQVFIDRKHTAVFQRNLDSSTGGRLIEIQANQFAAALLMPEEMVQDAVRNLPAEIDDGTALQMLASSFDVSTQAMYLRLVRMGIFSEGPSTVLD